MLRQDANMLYAESVGLNCQNVKLLRRGQLGQSLQPVDPEAASTKNVRRLHQCLVAVQGG